MKAKISKENRRRRNQEKEEEKDKKKKEWKGNIRMIERMKIVKQGKNI